MGSDQLYREAVEAGVHEEEWELFLRERIERKIEEHRFTATCMEMKLLKSIRYPHSKLNISNEELYARACIDRVPEDEWRTFIENALGMSLGKYSGVWRANGKWDVSKKELANAQDHVPMLLNARIEPAFTGVAAGVQAETNLLKAAGAHFSSYRVATRFGSGFINCTRCGKGDTHVLFLHGYGTGLAIWAQTMSSLANEFVVHALDLPGFGCSSQLDYQGSDQESAIRYFTDALADWQVANKLDKVAIVGHSFGAFVAAHYSNLYANRVSQLILVEPWGLLREPQGAVVSFTSLVRFLGKIKDPLKFARAAGPWGPSGLFYVPPDVGDFQDFFSPASSEFSQLWEAQQNEKSTQDVAAYLQQTMCLFQSGPAYKAFQNLARTSQLWAKEPLEQAQIVWPNNTCLIFGEHSWMDRSMLAGFVQQDESRRVHIVPTVGHHVYMGSKDFIGVILEELYLSKPQRSYQNTHL